MKACNTILEKKQVKEIKPVVYSLREEIGKAFDSYDQLVYYAGW